MHTWISSTATYETKSAPDDSKSSTYHTDRRDGSRWPHRTPTISELPPLRQTPPTRLTHPGSSVRPEARAALYPCAPSIKGANIGTGTNEQVWQHGGRERWIGSQVRSGPVPDVRLCMRYAGAKRNDTAQLCEDPNQPRPPAFRFSSSSHIRVQLVPQSAGPWELGVLGGFRILCSLCAQVCPCSLCVLMIFTGRYRRVV